MPEDNPLKSNLASGGMGPPGCRVSPLDCVATPTDSSLRVGDYDEEGKAIGNCAEVFFFLLPWLCLMILPYAVVHWFLREQLLVESGYRVIRVHCLPHARSAGRRSGLAVRPCLSGPAVCSQWLSTPYVHSTTQMKGKQR